MPTSFDKEIYFKINFWERVRSGKENKENHYQERITNSLYVGQFVNIIIFMWRSNNQGIIANLLCLSTVCEGKLNISKTDLL